MPKLIITDRTGKKSEIEYDSNFTLMETLRDNGYDIEASCGAVSYTHLTLPTILLV